MAQGATLYPTLAGTLWPTGKANAVLRNIVLAVAGAALMTIAAKIRIPFYPVPMSMQTFVVLTLGMAYGWRLGGATFALYLAEGALGLPVFAGTPEKGIGLAYMMGSTGGYLIGFVLAAMAVGWLAERGWDRSMVRTAGAMLIGNAIIYVPGLLWLGGHARTSKISPPAPARGRSDRLDAPDRRPERSCSAPSSIAADRPP